VLDLPSDAVLRHVRHVQTSEPSLIAVYFEIHQDKHLTPQVFRVLDENSEIEANNQYEHNVEDRPNNLKFLRSFQAASGRPLFLYQRKS
jgi:hypothetical protein